MKRIAVLTVVLLAAPASAADDPKAAGAKVADYLKSINGMERARITPVKEDYVAKLFPKHTFVAVLYPQFPVGREAPAPLKEANVIAVPKDGKVVPLSDVKALEKFFAENAPKVKTGNEDLIVKAWLRLAQELAQDGFYKFKAPASGGATGKSDGKIDTVLTVDGSVAVDPAGGNKGDIKATIHFKDDGSIAKIDHKVNLQPGPRPRCQATKLLDPDPIVRQMAEDSIRVMGSAAKYYLDEQRAKAPPELQKAIDRIWQRIVEEGR